MLKEILAVTGKSGLHKMVSQGKNMVIVESLTDGKRFPVHGYTKISSLQDIAIFTQTGEVPLKDVFKAIADKNSNQQVTIVDKNEEYKSFFVAVLPEYDQERVYVSDIKKVVKWYNQLVDCDLLSLLETVEEQPAEENAKAE